MRGSSPLGGRTILVTGVTRGLGRQVALELAAGGATLLLHGRSRTRLDEVAAELRTVVPELPVRTYLADLSDLDQVRAMADRILTDEPGLDVLVNNAAIGGGVDLTRRELSHQGYELRFAVNYLAPYVLTRRLVPVLAASAPARVVNVASMSQAPLDFGNVFLDREYDGIRAYRQSKLAMVMMTFDLAAELRTRGITVNALHPATLMDTHMVRQSRLSPESGVDDGVRPTLRLITEPALDSVTGRFFDRFTDSPAHEQAYDRTVRARLAELTRELVVEPDRRGRH